MPQLTPGLPSLPTLSSAPSISTQDAPTPSSSLGHTQAIDPTALLSLDSALSVPSISDGRANPVASTSTGAPSGGYDFATLEALLFSDLLPRPPLPSILTPQAGGIMGGHASTSSTPSSTPLAHTPPMPSSSGGGGVEEFDVDFFLNNLLSAPEASGADSLLTFEEILRGPMGSALPVPTSLPSAGSSSSSSSSSPVPLDEVFADRLNNLYSTGFREELARTLRAIANTGQSWEQIKAHLFANHRHFKRPTGPSIKGRSGPIPWKKATREIEAAVSSDLDLTEYRDEKAGRSGTNVWSKLAKSRTIDAIWGTYCEWVLNKAHRAELIDVIKEALLHELDESAEDRPDAGIYAVVTGCPGNNNYERVLAFMGGMATSGEVSGYRLAHFERDWQSTKNSRWIRNQLRMGEGAAHEWIPCDQMLAIVKTHFEAKAGGAPEPGWIELQNLLRSPTTSVIFNPATCDSEEEVVYDDSGARAREATIKTLQGHSGAIYVKRLKDGRVSSKACTQAQEGSSGFHGHLRTAFEAGRATRGSNTERLVATIRGIYAVYKRWVWDGRTIPRDLWQGPYFREPGMRTSLTISELAEGQREAFAAIRAKFAEVAAALHLDVRFD
ncbi:MAG TPA: hypothetical protein VFZ66_13125 [Herpetosiphonaceae bacterium]